MHTKFIGTSGELYVSHYLYSKGIPVFLELGDISKTDIIALKDNTPVRIQVKTYKSNKGAVELKLKKNSTEYNTLDFDLVALYVYDYNIILWIPVEKLKNKKSLKIRLNKSINNQSKNVNKAEDYLKIPI